MFTQIQCFVYIVNLLTEVFQVWQSKKSGKPSQCTWTLDNPMFEDFVLYTGILIAKLLALGLVKEYHRFKTNTSIIQQNNEEFRHRNYNVVDSKFEKAERIYRTNLENVPLFFITGLLYILTGPPEALAKMLFKVYTTARVHHTLLYYRDASLQVLPFSVAYGVQISMVFGVVCAFSDSHNWT